MIITLTTDFGEGSPYVAAMKGVILSLADGSQIIDITHAIPPQDVRQGALVLAAATQWFPPETVHLAVVDPDVGTQRRIVYARIDDQDYVAPDNGLLSRVAARQRPTSIVSIEDPEYWLPQISATFHGRDIMAPVAAQLSLGLDPQLLGPRLNSLVTLDWPRPHAGPGRLRGTVVLIDSFGNLITDIGGEFLPTGAAAESLTVSCHGQSSQGLARTYGDCREQSLIALVGSAGFLEIAVVRGSAAKTLNASVGSVVEVAWQA